VTTSGPRGSGHGSRPQGCSSSRPCGCRAPSSVRPTSRVPGGHRFVCGGEQILRAARSWTWSRFVPATTVAAASRQLRADRGLWLRYSLALLSRLKGPERPKKGTCLRGHLAHRDSSPAVDARASARVANRGGRGQARVGDPWSRDAAGQDFARLRRRGTTGCC